MTLNPAAPSYVPCVDGSLLQAWHWRDPVTRLDHEGQRQVLKPHQMEEARRTLPIYQMRQEIVEMVARNQVLVVSCILLYWDNETWL